MLKTFYDYTFGALFSHIVPKTVSFKATLIGSTEYIKGKVQYSGMFDAEKMRQHLRTKLADQGVLGDITFEH